MKVIKGDLIALAKAGHFDVIIHGCNCQVKMGAGIAKQIKNHFPEAWEADKDTEDLYQTAQEKLGRVSMARRLRPSPDHRYLRIVNAYTQVYPGSGSLSYTAIRSCFNRVAELARAYVVAGEEYRIGYPMIGAGLAGGDWAIISKIIDEELEGLDHTLVVLPTLPELITEGESSPVSENYSLTRVLDHINQKTK